ncbi:hypothetical protein IQ07DRAFT_634723 [Pyrenochaeta sp. DS3sAY3a]|nr:hypothetical protein IQ07DRAFT_634723 [Pyrenochaeta sp. DS3sAY3a]
MTPPPSALAAVELSDTTFLFYVNSHRNIGFLKGDAASEKITEATVYGEPQQVLVDGAPVNVVKGFPHLGAVAYNNTQIRVYYVADNPKVPDENILKEIASDDLGKTWFYGALGREKDGVSYSVSLGSGINAVYLPGVNQFRVYFTKVDEASLAVAYMPAGPDYAKGDWNCAPHLREINKPW